MHVLSYPVVKRERFGAFGVFIFPIDSLFTGEPVGATWSFFNHLIVGMLISEAFFVAVARSVWLPLLRFEQLASGGNVEKPGCEKKPPTMTQDG